jgi:hypothetical protein
MVVFTATVEFEDAEEKIPVMEKVNLTPEKELEKTGRK